MFYLMLSTPAASGLQTEELLTILKLPDVEKFDNIGLFYFTYATKKLRFAPGEQSVLFLKLL